MAVWNSNPSTIVSDNKEVVRDLCTKAIERVDRAIENHRKGVAEDLSVTMLERVRTELVRMNEVLSPTVFQPTFGAFHLGLAR
jgi:hypothetical protein